MLKTMFTGKGRLFWSLSLIGLLSLYSAGTARAQGTNQDASPNAGNNQSQAEQAADRQLSIAQNSNAPNSPNDPNANPSDPPSRAARISLLEGSVSLQPGGQGDWGNAVRNRPVTVSDKIWVDQNSRAELQSGAATFHLGNMTAMSFLNLDGNTTQVRIAEGGVNFRVREMREGDIYEVDTPNVAFTVKEAGAFRIDVSENGDGTRITAIRGSGDVTGAGQTYTVHTGERAEFVGTDGNIKYVAHGAEPPDALDRWANDRDLREDNSTSAKYVNPDVPGVADLDDNGTWSEQPNVGAVWTPNNVGPDWAPYSDGSWNYVGPWGWSWVGYEPWGYAPYHYGRWNYYGGRWGWAPGPYWASPYYGPAFVGFLGGGFGFGVGFGVGFGFGGGVGWFPLGCGEPFHPWYHAGAGYVRNVNINNTVIHNTNVINNHNFNYAYAHNAHAVTAASRNTFVNGERVNRGATHVTEASLRNATVSNSAGVAPNHSNYTGASRTAANVATSSSAASNHGVVAYNTTTGTTTGTTSSRQNEIAANRPPSSTINANRSANTRTWSAQGNTTDHGNAPQGAGHSNTLATNSRAHLAQTDRPQWAQGTANTQRSLNTSATNVNRAPNTNASRTYTPQRAYTPPARTYSAPARTYSAPSAPSHSNPAPSHPSGGSSAPHGGGGSSAPHGGGGGGSHGGGGGGSHH
jgi:hypothetical protein